MCALVDLLIFIFHGAKWFVVIFGLVVKMILRPYPRFKYRGKIACYQSYFEGPVNQSVHSELAQRELRLSRSSSRCFSRRHGDVVLTVLAVRLARSFGGLVVNLVNKGLL